VQEFLFGSKQNTNEKQLKAIFDLLDSLIIEMNYKGDQSFFYRSLYSHT